MTVLSHWHKLIDNLQGSSVDFYQRVEAIILERSVPKLEGSRQRWHEGGPLSAKREYLRLVRERLLFDVCAAPFGSGFFVSWRLCEKPVRVSVLGLLVLLAGVGLLGWQLLERPLTRFLHFGRIDDSLIWIGAVVMGLLLAVLLMRGIVARGLSDIDALLLKTPIIGPYYEVFLRPVTYYRIDLALMYQDAVHSAVIQVVDELSQAQGIPLLSELDRKPILTDLYRR